MSKLVPSISHQSFATRERILTLFNDQEWYLKNCGKPFSLKPSATNFHARTLTDSTGRSFTQVREAGYCVAKEDPTVSFRFERCHGVVVIPSEGEPTLIHRTPNAMMTGRPVYNIPNPLELFFDQKDIAQPQQALVIYSRGVDDIAFRTIHNSAEYLRGRLVPTELLSVGIRPFDLHLDGDELTIWDWGTLNGKTISFV